MSIFTENPKELEALDQTVLIIDDHLDPDKNFEDWLKSLREYLVNG